LGGLGDPDADLSPHLRSRQKTGEALREAGVPVTEFRAAIIVGSGSVSFEMIRYLTERIPVMICPRWVYTRVQPIGVRNALEYMVAALEKPESRGKVIEIGGSEVLTYGEMMMGYAEVGGSEVLTYGEMMMGYAEVRGLHRVLLSVPVLTPRLSSHWVHWTTPVQAEIARPLIEGLRNEVIVRDDTALHLFPDIQPMDYRASVQLALARLEASQVETAWSDALVTSQGDITPVVLTTQEGMIIERRQRFVRATPTDVYRAFAGLGGERGWLYANWVWQLRGVLDRLIGGVGLRRGRRHPNKLRAGDALDFWRVEAVEPDSLLRLRAEMTMPGDAWLQFEARPQSEEQTLLLQTAFFAPKGLSGFLYWYLLYPLHGLVFSGLIRNLARWAEQSRKRENLSFNPDPQGT
jgi:hypothetical protein